MSVDQITAKTVPDPHLCYPTDYDVNPATIGASPEQVALFEGADKAITRKRFEDPIIQQAAEVCLNRCSQLEACQTDAQRWVEGHKVQSIEIGKANYFMIGATMCFLEKGARKLLPVAMPDTETISGESISETVLTPIVCAQGPMPAMSLRDEPVEIRRPLRLVKEVVPDEEDLQGVVGDTTEEDVPSLVEFAESRARKGLSEREAAISERLTAGPAAFHELLGVLRILNPKAEPRDLLKILADLKLRLMNDKQGPQLARAEKIFGDKTSFNMFGIGASQDELGKAAEDLHTIESRGRDTDMNCLPAKNSQPAKELLLSFEAFCGENNDFFITFKKGSILAFVEKKGIYNWKELLGAPTTYHLFVLRHLMQAEQPTDIKEMYRQLTGQDTTSPSDRRFVEFEIAATLIVEICRKAKVLQMSNGMSHPRDASGMWLLRRTKRGTE